MVVSKEWQGRGCGRKLLQSLETRLAGRGFTHLFMHARVVAVGFYEKLGYLKTGEEFIELGIAHVRMEKRLI
jgi:ribosomal protein S18 acetylase RimI-like enzyme